MIETYVIMLFSQQSFTEKLYVHYFVIMVVKIKYWYTFSQNMEI